MDLQSRLRQHKPLLDTLMHASAHAESLGFGDLLWDLPSLDDLFDRLTHRRDPGVQFTTSKRTFVLEEHSGELRFYSGGWHDAIYDEPGELGVFPTAGEALAYAVAFLAHAQHPAHIDVRRGVLSRHDPKG